MPIVIQPFRREHESAVKSFNQRLRAVTNDPNLVFHHDAEPEWLAKVAGSPIYDEYFVAVDGSEVRGAYALKHERLYRPGQAEYAIACYHHPIAEGIVDRKYSSVGGLMLRDALQREPMLYALGMGGLDRPLAQMLKAMGWKLHVVPFYFRVLRPYRFLREMDALRSGWKRWAMDLAAFTGMGWAALTAVQGAKRVLGPGPGSFDAVEVAEFSDWADTVWMEAKDEYALASVRDRQTLARLYPASEAHLTKVLVERNGRSLGWAVAAERRKDAKFGQLRVGSIVDCWARPENAAAVILAAVRSLERQGVDLIVTNQSHNKWGRALEGCGFFRAESNFIFAVSKKHAALLDDANWDEFHITRANGDGLPRNF